MHFMHVSWIVGRVGHQRAVCRPSRGEADIAIRLGNQGMKPSLPGRSLMRPGLCMPARPIWNGSRPHNVELEPPSCCRLPCCYRELSSRSMAAVARAHATIAARSQHLQDVILELKPAPGLQPDIGADALQPCKCAGPITILSES